MRAGALMCLGLSSRVAPVIIRMNDHAAKLRQCMARFEGYLLVDGLSAELTAVYRAEIEADQAMLDVDVDIANDERRRRRLVGGRSRLAAFRIADAKRRQRTKGLPRAGDRRRLGSHRGLE
jgi:hypothetical protein